jgi:hypothetical protein
MSFTCFKKSGQKNTEKFIEFFSGNIATLVFPTLNYWSLTLVKLVASKQSLSLLSWKIISSKTLSADNYYLICQKDDSKQSEDHR